MMILIVMLMIMMSLTFVFADLTGPIGATILLKPSMIIMVLGLETGKLNIFFVVIIFSKTIIITS